MKKPKIYAKGSLTHEQLSVKEKIGCDGLEVQLLGELIADRNSGIYHSPVTVFDLYDLSCHDIRVIHAPLVPGAGDVVLEVLCDSKDIKLLDGIFEIAEYYGRLNNRFTTVVLHSEVYYEQLNDMGDCWKRIVEALYLMLKRYPHTEVVIENVSPLRGIGKGKELHLANNFAFDNVVMVQKLREELHTDRVGLCLDTCHAMLTNKYISLLYQAVGDVPIPDLSMRKYFEEYQQYLKLIHLCDIHGSGYGRGRHGVPFDEQSYDKLSGILDLYKEFNCDCPITLEVEETDFSVCDGYRKTKCLVDKYFE